MTDLGKALVGLSALAFVVAIFANYGIDVVPFPTTTSEGFSRASTNLALLAIAVVLCFRTGRSV
jgi:hypothetical protein